MAITEDRMRGGWEESRLRDHGHLVTAARGTETPNTKVQMKLAVYSDPLDRAITQSYGSEASPGGYFLDMRSRAKGVGGVVMGPDASRGGA
ncbi:hypothetical protein PTI98_009240 [Pleurotus ostreatus]|nr:hypothetical protein PTI98_009240 [Pleurotus ostreatus]